MAKYQPNPFGDPEGSNPFTDAAPSFGASSAANTGTNGQSFTAAPAAGPPRQPPAANSPFGFYEDTNRPPAVYGSMSSPTQPAVGSMSPSYVDNARSNTNDLRLRQEELERKAAELDRRELDLRNSPNNVKKNNWPPINCGCIHPCFYQDFDVDISLEYKKIVKTMYYLWLGYSLILLLNMIACIAYVSVYASVESNSTFTTFGLSILWVVLFAPCSFLLWYRPLYKAFRSDSSMNFFIFFGIFAFQCGVTITQSLGIDQCGTAGIINGIKLITHAGANFVGVGIFLLIVGGLFAMLAVVDILMLIRIHHIYRTTGASFAKAKQEFAVAGLSNPHVQNVAVDVAGRAAQDAFSGRGQF